MLRLLKYAIVALVLYIPMGARAQTPGLPGFTQFFYANMTGTGTTTFKAGPGTLHAITINTPTATTTLTIYDNTAGSGTKIGTYTIASSPQPSSVIYDVAFGKGLTIVMGTANSDITVSFR